MKILKININIHFHPRINNKQKLCLHFEGKISSIFRLQKIPQPYIKHYTLKSSQYNVGKKKFKIENMKKYIILRRIRVIIPYIYIYMYTLVYTHVYIIINETQTLNYLLGIQIAPS